LLVQTSFRSMAYLWLSPEAGRAGWSNAEARKIWKFGGQVTVIGLLQSAALSLPTAILGRHLAPTALGQYNRADLMVRLPMDAASSSISRVLFPALAKVHQDRVRFRGGYETAVAVSAAVLVSGATLLAVVAGPLVQVVLGPGWEDAARVLPLLAAAGTFNYLAHLPGVALEATATLRGKLVVEAIILLALIGTLLLTAPSGLMVASAGLAALAALRCVATNALLKVRLGVSLRASLAPFFPALLCGVTVLAIGTTASALSGHGHPIVQLLIVVCLCAGGLLGLQFAPPILRVRRNVMQRIRAPHPAEAATMPRQQGESQC
jgi:O-antigen/teichoic acid export membrane protein